MKRGEDEKDEKEGLREKKKKRGMGKNEEDGEGKMKKREERVKRVNGKMMRKRGKKGTQFKVRSEIAK